MAFVDEVERCGRAVENGEMTESTAVQILISAAETLTKVGAADLLARWREARGLYAGVAVSAAAGLDECWGLT